MPNPQLDFDFGEPEPSNNVFTEYLDSLALSAPHITDELEDYLTKHVESLDSRDEHGRIKRLSPLEWWVQHRDMYPCLSRMALDYLSVPCKSFLLITYHFLNAMIATSVDVERVFSKGRLSISYLRNRLSVQTTRALLCLNVWINKGFLLDKEMVGWIQGQAVVMSEDEDDVAEGWDTIA